MAMDQGSIVYDYIVFVLFILGSTLVAIWSKYSGPKEKTKSDYVFGTVGSVSMGAMMLSIARGTLGVRSFLGKLLYIPGFSIILDRLTGN